MENQEISSQLFEDNKQENATIHYNQDDSLDLDKNNNETFKIEQNKSVLSGESKEDLNNHYGNTQAKTTTKTKALKSPKTKRNPRAQHIRNKCVTNFVNSIIKLVRRICSFYKKELEKLNILNYFGTNVYAQQKFFNSTIIDILSKNRYNKKILSKMFFNKTINYLSKTSLKTIYEENYMKNSKKFKYSENENDSTIIKIQTFDEVLENLEDTGKITEDDIPRFQEQSKNLIRDIYLQEDSSIKPRKSSKRNSLNESDEI